MTRLHSAHARPGRQAGLGQALTRLVRGAQWNCARPYGPKTLKAIENNACGQRPVELRGVSGAFATVWKPLTHFRMGLLQLPQTLDLVQNVSGAFATVWKPLT